LTDEHTVPVRADQATAPAGRTGGGRAPFWPHALDAVAVAAVIACIALTAWWAFPSWDDALFWLAAEEKGARFLPGMVPDRPVLGWLWGQFAAHGVIGPGAVAYLAIWSATALVTYRCWTVTFPEWRRYAVAPALIAVSPVLVETQAVAVNPVLTGHLGTVLVYAAFLLLNGVRSRRWMVRALAATIIFVGGMVSEYAALASLVAAAMFMALPASSPAALKTRRREYVALAIVGIVSYLIFRLTSDPNARPEVNVEHQVAANGLRRALELGIRVPLSLWHGILGEFLKDLGEINFSRVSVVGLPVGAVVAAAVGLALRARGRTSAGSEHPERQVVLAGVRMGVAFAAGLTVITFMASTIRGNLSSRLWTPLFPPAACLTTWALFLVVRRELRTAVIIAVAFLAGYLSGKAALGARYNRGQMVNLGAEIHRRLAPEGTTVAVFVNAPTNHFLGDPVARPYELIAQLTTDWPQNDRDRFWAGAYEWQPLRDSLPGLSGVCGAIPAVASEARGWSRRGPVARTLWVSFDPDGGSHIEEARPIRGTNNP
jgi:hypothetical protein